MAEYIERENLFKFLTEKMTRKQNGAFAKGFNKGIMVARAAVHNKEITPTADVVKVARCKDCKYGKIDDSGTTICVLNSECDAETGVDYGFVSYCSESHFCSYGERRSENES